MIECLMWDPEAVVTRVQDPAEDSSVLGSILVLWDWCQNVAVDSAAS